jgi:ribonuclease PH
LTRRDGRASGQLREVKIRRSFLRSCPGSVLISAGRTSVLCTASWVTGVPAWKVGKGGGWLTAEYDMLPASTAPRRNRNRSAVDGRTQEIQRLIGRSLRTVVDLGLLGENTLYVDCDVLEADGGTRTASITGAYLALCDTVRHLIQSRLIVQSPIRQAVAAVSVGKVAGQMLLDLDYSEDVAAEVDMNVVMTQSGEFVEVQATGETGTFSNAEFGELLALARQGIGELLLIQSAALGETSDEKLR